MKALDLHGKKFGRLLVLEPVKRPKNQKGGGRKWRCLCACGQLTEAASTDLTLKKKASCGCLKKDLMRQKNAKHGACQRGESLPEYVSWLGLRQKHPDLPKVWDDFLQFFCDVGERPTPEHRLSRRNGLIPHGPNNTYWRLASEDAEPQSAAWGDDPGIGIDLWSLCRPKTPTEERKTTARKVPWAQASTDPNPEPRRKSLTN